jgi:hypothetical protein
MGSHNAACFEQQPLLYKLVIFAYRLLECESMHGMAFVLYSYAQLHLNATYLPTYSLVVLEACGKSNRPDGIAQCMCFRLALFLGTCVWDIWLSILV